MLVIAAAQNLSPAGHVTIPYVVLNIAIYPKDVLDRFDDDYTRIFYTV